MAGSITDTSSADHTVAALITSVRNGRVNGGEFCAEVSRLNPSDHTRVVQALLEEYKVVNNFTRTTANDARAVNRRP